MGFLMRNLQGSHESRELVSQSQWQKANAGSNQGNQALCEKCEHACQSMRIALFNESKTIKEASNASKSDKPWDLLKDSMVS